MVSQTVQDSSPAGLFAALRPGEPLPAELAGFEQLSGAADPSERAVESSIGIGGEPQLVDKHADSSGPHFRDFHRMCPTSLRDIRQSYPASASGCWLNVGGPGATASLATHSQIFVGSYVGNTILTYTYNGGWVRTDTAVEGQNITIVAWSGKSDDKFLTREHRYDLSGTHRHVGVAYVRAGSARGPLSSTSVVW
jgi:hypothetical protein